jgi:hypothetical protein
MMGVVEDDYIAARYLAIREQQAAQAASRRINLLVHQQKISHQQGAFHALRGDEVGLEHKGVQKEGHYNQ